MSVPAARMDPVVQKQDGADPQISIVMCDVRGRQGSVCRSAQMELVDSTLDILAWEVFMGLVVVRADFVVTQRIIAVWRRAASQVLLIILSWGFVWRS